MDDILEKIDMIRERTGVSYKQAKEALEGTGGDVLDAIIFIEDKQKGNPWTEQITVAGTEVVDKLKEIIRKGNISRIRVKKGDYLILDTPVTAGAVGTVLMPYIATLGAAVALMSKCTIEIERPNQNSININEEMIEMMKMAESKAKEYMKIHGNKRNFNDPTLDDEEEKGKENNS